MKTTSRSVALSVLVLLLAQPALAMHHGAAPHASAASHPSASHGGSSHVTVPPHGSAPHAGAPAHGSTPHVGVPAHGSTPHVGVPAHGSTPHVGVPAHGSTPHVGVPAHGSTPHVGVPAHDSAPHGSGPSHGGIVSGGHHNQPGGHMHGARPVPTGSYGGHAIGHMPPHHSHYARPHWRPGYRTPVIGYPGWFWYNGSLVYNHGGFYYDDLGNEVTMTDDILEGEPVAGRVQFECCNIL
jgi:hypothetical protein